MKTVKFVDSVGFFVFCLYLFLHYVPQLFFHQIFYDQFVRQYEYVNVSLFFPVLFIFLFLLVVVLVEKVSPKIKIRFVFKNYQVLTQIILSGVIILFLLFSIYFKINYGIGFRHEYRLRDAGRIVQVLWVFRSVLMVYIFFLLSRFFSGKSPSVFNKLQLFFTAVAYFLSLNGSTDVFCILILCLFLFINKDRVKIFFFRQSISLRITTLIKGVCFFLGMGCVVFVVVFIGVANKIGSEQAVRFFLEIDLIKELVMSVILRLSTDYVSLLNVYRGLFDYGIQQEVIIGYGQRIFDRINLLFPILSIGLSDEINTVNRLNYLTIFNNKTLPIAGTSPGLLGSIAYLPIFPFNIIIIVMYSLFIIRAINRYFPMPARVLNLVSKFIILYFVGFLFSSPLDLLVVFEPQVMYFALFFFFSFIPFKKKE
jgi:hypothetical protein